jgi:hypothetical protein
MTQDPPGRAGRDIALEDMQIRAADGGLGDSDDRVRRSGDLRHRPIFDRLETRPLVDKRFHVRSFLASIREATS